MLEHESQLSLATAHMLTDQDLAKFLQVRNQDAFHELHRRYSSLVRAVALRILRNAVEAEDVAQIVFTDLYRALNRYSAAKGTLRTWLLQYAYSRSINHKRSLESKAYYNTADLSDPKTDLPTCNGVRVAEASLIVREALGSLTGDQQITLRMIFLEGMEMEDVAAHLQQNLSNVRHHYYRGLRKLREVLQEKAQDGRPPERRPSV
jgi:RNA polymerase sigma-70 factor, ECF subfamily